MENFGNGNLANLALHDITRELGERGLEERFELEIQKFDIDDQLLLGKAKILAKDLHENDRRTTEPYINHIYRVAIRLMSHYGVEDVDIVIAALLHDSVEDHAQEIADPFAVNKRDAALNALSSWFNARVANLVSALTNPEPQVGISKTDQYRSHVEEELEDPWVRVIKVSDFTDNCVGIQYTKGPKMLYLAKRYMPLIPIFIESILKEDTPLSDNVKKHIIAQLNLAQERVESVLAA